MQNSISNWETPGDVDINRTKVIGDLTQELHLFLNSKNYDHYRIPTFLNDS